MRKNKLSIIILLSILLLSSCTLISYDMVLIVETNFTLYKIECDYYQDIFFSIDENIYILTYYKSDVLRWFTSKYPIIIIAYLPIEEILNEK